MTLREELRGYCCQRALLAVNEANGNKRIAAGALGISLASLYRYMDGVATAPRGKGFTSKGGVALNPSATVAWSPSRIRSVLTAQRRVAIARLCDEHLVNGFPDFVAAAKVAKARGFYHGHTQVDLQLARTWRRKEYWEERLKSLTNA